MDKFPQTKREGPGNGKGWDVFQLVEETAGRDSWRSGTCEGPWRQRRSALPIAVPVSCGNPPVGFCVPFLPITLPATLTLLPKQVLQRAPMPFTFKLHVFMEAKGLNTILHDKPCSLLIPQQHPQAPTALGKPQLGISDTLSPQP